MNLRAFIVSVLAKWIVTRGDFEELLALELIGGDADGEDMRLLLPTAQQAFHELRQTDLTYFNQFCGDRERLKREIAAALHWGGIF